MSNTAKILIGVIVAAVIAFSIWYFTRKKTDAPGTTTAPPPPGAANPETSDIQRTDIGPGKAAIDRRVGELLNSSAATEIQNQVRANTDILKGVSAVKVNYYNGNISRAPITSAKNIPLNLTPSQKSALLGFTTINTTQGETSLNNLRIQNREMMDQIGTCYVGNDELANGDDFLKQVVCQQYEDCGKKYKFLHASAKLNPGALKAGGDMSKMSTAWLNAAHQFDQAVQDRAISDLRSAGWKFQGFDF